MMLAFVHIHIWINIYLQPTASHSSGLPIQPAVLDSSCAIVRNPSTLSNRPHSVLLAKVVRPINCLVSNLYMLKRLVKFVLSIYLMYSIKLTVFITGSVVIYLLFNELDVKSIKIHNLALMFGPTLFNSGEERAGSKKKDTNRKKKDQKREEFPVHSNSHLAFNMIMQGQIVEYLLTEHNKFEALQGPIQTYST
uniref:Transmembrane protein n=1 Tax=Heterorhabditis bacteriophora TaxID=37862 RepID=A0A1I7XKF1_HETBA